VLLLLGLLLGLLRRLHLPHGTLSIFPQCLRLSTCLHSQQATHTTT
jgi:hypothetical protein